MEKTSLVEKLVKRIINKKILVLIVCILLLMSGVYSYTNIAKQEMPDITAIYGYVQVTAPGLNSEQVNSEIAVDIEHVISDYSEVKAVETTAVDNACFIFIEMNIDDSDSKKTLDEIKNVVLNLDFDEAVTDVSFSSDTSSAGAIYAVHSDTLSETEIETLSAGLASKLSRLEAVDKAVVNSAFDEEIVVSINSAALQQFSITTEDLYNIIVANGIEIPLGYTEYEGNEATITVNSSYTDVQEISGVVIYSDGVNIFTVSDVADVTKQNTALKKTYTFSGETAAFVEVFFDDNTDLTLVTDELSEAVRHYSFSIDDASVSTVISSPEHVKDQIGQVMLNLVACVLIVMFVVILGLGLRNSVVIAVSIPITFLSTIGVLYFLGEKIQLMSIAGLIISIGILVDNSIVISEAVQHYVDRGINRGEACVMAVKNNYLPVLTSTITTVAAFIPLLSLPGVSGDVAYTLPLTVMSAIIISYIVAITITPSIAAKMIMPTYKKPKKEKKHSGKILETMLRRTFKLGLLPVILSFITLIVLGYFVIMNLEIDVLPKTEKSIVYINYEYDIANDNEGSIAYANKIENVIEELPDVANYGYAQGGGLPRFYVTLDVVSVLPQYGQFFIEFDCPTSDLDIYMGMLETELANLRDEGSYTVNRLELAPPTAPVKIILSSYDLQTLQSNANTIFERVQNLDSYKSGSLVSPGYKTDIVINFDRDLLMRYGLTSVEAQQQITTAVNGLSEDLFELGNRTLSVKVVSDIKTAQDILGLNIKTRDGLWLTVGDVATIEEAENLEYIYKYNGVPAVVINADMAPGYGTYDLESDISSVINDTIESDVNVIYKGDNELTNELISSISFALVVALLLVYFTMYFQFKSFLQPTIIMVSIPLSFVGSLAALLAMGEMITLTGLLGLVSLVGIVVNNGILLVEYINREIRLGVSLYEACITSVKRRMRPILLSSLTTILGLIPLAFFGGDFFRPMAVTFMGGLITSTLLVIFIVPSLYYFFYKKRRGFR